MRGNNINQGDWLGLERIVPGYGDGGRAGMDISRLDGVVGGLEVTGAGNGEAFVAGDTAGVGMEQSLGAVEEWDISFGDLLALAEAASTAAGNPGSAGHIGADRRSNFGFHDGLSVPDRFTYDLNFPPGAVRDLATPQFAPLTPGKAGRAENDSVQNLNAHDVEYANRNEVATLEVEASQLRGPSRPDNEELELSKTPQQKPKRRKHRPKVVREGKTKQSPKPTMTPKTNGSAENPTGKRKYVRKANKPAAPQAQENIESADPKQLEPQSTKNSCRRTLKFCTQDENQTQRSISDLYSESRVQNFCNEAMVIRSRSRTQISQGIESRVQNFCNETVIQSKPRAGISQGIESRVGNTQPGLAYDLTCSEVLEDCDQVTVCEDIVKTAMNSQSASRSPNDPTCSTSAVLTEEQARRSKRKSSSVIEEASNKNRNGVQFNTLQFYASLMHFPNIYKKGRSEKGQTSVVSNTSSCSIAMQPPITCHQDGVKESFAPKVNNWTQVRDLSSLNKPAECQLQPTYSAKQGLVVGYTQRVENSKRKRSKERNYISGLTSSCTNKTPLHQQMVLYKHQQSSVKSSAFTAGGQREVTIWKDLIDAVTEQFKYLDINRESNTNGALYQERNALVPYNQDQNALIYYRSDGTIVPFQGAFSPIRKQRPRPKVDLDDETNKVWRLLLENINNEGIDGTDEEKRRWWREERRVFRGRADSFIARMHLVQGDRRFSRWKGSVVDSVIGVFLTQNVSDHLSSSAYMALAARYPLKSERNHNPLEEEEAFLVKEPEVCMQDSEQTIEWMKKMSSQQVSDQSSMTLHDNEHNEEKEVVNSLIDKAKCSALNCNESDLEMYHDSATRTETSSFALNRKAANDVASPRNSLNSSQNTVESSIAQTADRVISYSGTNSEAEELGNRLEPTFMQLLKMAGASMLHNISSNRSVNAPCRENCKEAHSTSEQSTLTGESGSQGIIQDPLTVLESSKSCSENNQPSDLQGNENVIIQSQNVFVGDSNADTLAQEQNKKVQQTLNLQNLSGETLDVAESTISGSDNQRNTKQKAEEDKALKEINSAKQKSRRVGREINNEIDWDTLRREAEANGKKRERTPNTMDSLDWEAVRCADVNDIADTIKERGMNNMLAERIKAFLNRLVKDHGSIDLEWLRDLSPDKAKEYLLSIRGLGLKSVECVRLLTLHHLAFPVDTNVGRIAVRLGWVPLQPLPESLQLHLLELYPVLESIQRYLWPRLCKLEQKQLYELHYQMITFGKVFCTKSRPNCNACPMRGECRHFASAFASARLALPAPEEKGIVPATEKTANLDNAVHGNGLTLPPPQAIQQLEGSMQLGVNLGVGKKSVVGSCEPIIEEPASPEPENHQDLEHDIEDAFYDDPDEIPIIKLNIEEFTQNLQNYMEKNMELQEGEMSKALVALTPEAASLPIPRLKNVSRLRTEHQVYELPDSHPLLEGRDSREPDDPCSYLLAIWTPGETPNSIQPPEGGCSNQESGKLCDQKTCFTCSSIREANSQMVRGTLLIPCRTAMRGSFPLNGTYFQVNEVFADHDSSLNPIDVPRSWIWNLPRRTVYFGTSVPSIFKGLPTEGIQHCFWRGYVCVRGFDYKTRAPRPLMARLHFPPSKLPKYKGRTVDE